MRFQQLVSFLEKGLVNCYIWVYETNTVQSASGTLQKNMIAIKTGQGYLLQWKHIILEDFLPAEKEHGVCYINFVGDGDSSVYPTLVSSVPGWGILSKSKNAQTTL